MKHALMAVLLLSALLCNKAMADGVGNFCPPFITNGTRVIDNPVYTNVFWDTSAAQWNIDNGSAGESQLVLDSILQALVNSAYFSQLAQYKVYSARMTPSITPNCGPAPATMDAFDNGIRALTRANEGCQEQPICCGPDRAGQVSTSVALASRGSCGHFCSFRPPPLRWP